MRQIGADIAAAPIWRRSFLTLMPQRLSRLKMLDGGPADGTSLEEEARIHLAIASFCCRQRKVRFEVYDTSVQLASSIVQV